MWGLFGQHTLTPEPVAGLRPLIPRLAVDQTTPLLAFGFSKNALALSMLLAFAFLIVSAAPFPFGLLQISLQETLVVLGLVLMRCS